MTPDLGSSDPRLTLAWRSDQDQAQSDVWDLADMALEGRVAAVRYVAPEPMQVTAPSSGLRRAPDPAAEQVDQLLFGERFEVLTACGAYVYGQARRDGYVGWTLRDALTPRSTDPTHWVRALRTLVFPQPSIKAPPVACLSANALVTVETENGRFAKLGGEPPIGGGWIAAGHLGVLGGFDDDPAEVALRYLGAPYHWGGRDSIGLDCSGLVQQALYACGRYAPRDSDMQAKLGTDVAGVTALVRNDLVFWRGHVGVMIDARTMIHANAYHMAVTVEPLDAAVDRILAAGGGPPTAFRRLSGLPMTAPGVPS